MTVLKASDEFLVVSCMANRGHDYTTVGQFDQSDFLTHKISRKTAVELYLLISKFEVHYKKLLFSVKTHCP